MKMGVHLQALTALPSETITLFVEGKSETVWTLWKREKSLSRAVIRTLDYPMHSLVTIPINGRFIFKIFEIGPFLLSNINSFLLNEQDRFLILKSLGSIPLCLINNYKV
jgi:hypothetical protein